MPGNSPLQDAIDRLMEREPRWERAISPPDQGAKPASRGKGLPSAGVQSTSGGGGFAESDYNARTYWPVTPSTVITSPDGLLTFEVGPIKSVALVGGGQATFKGPDSP